MSQNVNPVNQGGRAGHIASPDLIVVGAGIFGLWAARHALKRGERVLVLEKRRVGDGASGGFLGALMPHLPDNWNAKKQMQFDALATMADAVAALEDDTGIDCGYRRCGRLMPMAHEKMPEIARRRIEGAKANWVDATGKQTFQMQLLAPKDLFATEFGGQDGQPWLNPQLARFGATYDTLSARINPRAYLGALAAYVRSETLNLGEIREGAEVVSFIEQQGTVSVSLESGETISAARLVIANGWEAYDLLKGAKAKLADQPITGRGVKGQAVLLEHAHADNLPIVYDNGSYIVPHARGKVAVGSTSVDDWMPLGLGRLDEEWATESFAGDLVAGDPMAEKLIEAAIRSFDREDMGFYDHALDMCTDLRGSPIIERWANVRPRNTVPDVKTGKVGTEPVFGVLDGSDAAEVKIGGFKISLGIGHVENH